MNRRIRPARRTLPLLLLSLAAAGMPLAGRAAPAPLAFSPPPPPLPPAAAALSGAAVATTLPTEIRLDLSRREISLVQGGRTLNSWPVAIGDPETPTPPGHYQVTNKVVDPVYQSTHTGEVKGHGPLGNRWIGFHSRGADQYGIHGTPWPEWVDSRAAVSNGCVRMRNEHIEVLFSAVQLGTPVIIQP